MRKSAPSITQQSTELSKQLKLSTNITQKQNSLKSLLFWIFHGEIGKERPMKKPLEIRTEEITLRILQDYSSLMESLSTVSLIDSDNFYSEFLRVMKIMSALLLTEPILTYLDASSSMLLSKSSGISTWVLVE